jgi:sRNA-binding carbon storage regulator CsrA
MLILTRRVGETIYIGDDVCITVYDKLRYHVMIGVLAPANIELSFSDTCVRPAVLPDGERFYLLTLVSDDVFSVGEARVRVDFRPSFLGAGALRARQVRIGIAAPKQIDVHREEIYVRKLIACGKPPPPMPFCDWLRQANLAVSCRAAS